MSTDATVVPTATTITPTVVVPTVTKKRKAKNTIVDRAGYSDNSGNRLMVYLRKRGDSFRVSVAVRAKKAAPVVGCKSIHATEQDARKSFEANKAKALAMGWKVAEISARQSSNPDGYFTISNFPTVDQKATAIAALKATVAKAGNKPNAKK